MSAASDLRRLRMLGLCAGCPYRPLTTIGTLRPCVAERLGIGLEVEGAREVAFFWAMDSYVGGTRGGYVHRTPMPEAGRVELFRRRYRPKAR